MLEILLDVIFERASLEASISDNSFLFVTRTSTEKQNKRAPKQAVVMVCAILPFRPPNRKQFCDSRCVFVCNIKALSVKNSEIAQSRVIIFHVVLREKVRDWNG